MIRFPHHCCHVQHYCVKPGSYTAVLSIPTTSNNSRILLITNPTQLWTSRDCTWVMQSFPIKEMYITLVKTWLDIDQNHYKLIYWFFPIYTKIFKTVWHILPEKWKGKCMSWDNLEIILMPHKLFFVNEIYLRVKKSSAKSADTQAIFPASIILYMKCTPP